MEVRQALGKFREVFLAEKTQKKLCLSQLGIEEELVSILLFIKKPVSLSAGRVLHF